MRKRDRGKGRERKEREKGGREEEAEMSELKGEVTEYLCIRLKCYHCPTSSLLKNLMIGGQLHFYKLFGKIRTTNVNYS